ncbi:hypothetical protein V6N13_121937 [Hibiscus sabdariffa]
MLPSKFVGVGFVYFFDEDSEETSLSDTEFVVLVFLVSSFDLNVEWMLKPSSLTRIRKHSLPASSSKTPSKLFLSHDMIVVLFSTRPWEDRGVGWESYQVLSNIVSVRFGGGLENLNDIAR